jgi:hypothetical protein
MPIIYDLKALALPRIRFVDRAGYKELAGQDAAPPNLAEDQKGWLDLDVMQNPGNYGRRVNYDWVLALNNDGSVKLVDTSVEPDATRRDFYAQYNIKQVPTFEPLQLLATQATGVNLGLEVAVGGDAPYQAWIKGPFVPFPVRPLSADEAFFPSPFDPLQIVMMAEYQKQVGPGPSEVSDKLDLVLAGLAAIKTKLGA